jgi:hypothetical protein
MVAGALTFHAGRVTPCFYTKKRGWEAIMPHNSGENLAIFVIHRPIWTVTAPKLHVFDHVLGRNSCRLADCGPAFGWFSLPPGQAGLSHDARPRTFSLRSGSHSPSKRAFEAGSFIHRNGWTYVLVLGVASVWAATLGPSVTLISAVIGGALTTQVHYWAHRPSRAPGLVRWLQKTGALQSPKHHARHHRPPHDRNYCALTDWVNPIIHAAIPTPSRTR